MSPCLGALSPGLEHWTLFTQQQLFWAEEEPTKARRTEIVTILMAIFDEEEAGRCEWFGKFGSTDELEIMQSCRPLCFAWILYVLCDRGS